ncbi:MAG: hypothetical protein PHI97_03855 [Desulfobulbus sp.]|nr:hypothetical protein [Desulfobulbus sp.]
MNSRFKFIYCMSLIVGLCASPALASDVFLKIDDNDFGQGILRPRGTECLIITPAHVVENGFTIDVITAEQTHASAEILELFPGDLSVLRVKSDTPISCRRTSWPSHASLNSLLATEKVGELHTMLADGSIRKSPVEIIGYDKYRNIYVRPTAAEDALAKGASGSPLYLGGQCAGMLLSIDKGVGNVIRQDALANTLALFFEDNSTATASHPLVPQKPTTAPPVVANPEIQQFSGTLFTNVAREHNLRLHENSPVQITLEPTGDKVQYALELVDSSHRISCSYSLKKGLDKEIILPCTPQTTDSFFLRIIGTGGEGSYKLHLTPLVSDATLRSDNNILQIDGDPQAGTIAKGAVAKYRIKLYANSPVRIIQQQTAEGSAYQLELTDSLGNSAYRLPSSAKPDPARLRIPWTPNKTDTYFLRVRGQEGIGPYSIGVQSIAFDAQLRGQANTLQLNGPSMGGTIATGAVAEYRFPMEAFSPVRFNFTATGDPGRFTVEVWDAKGTLVFRDPHRLFSGQENSSLPVTVSDAGTYTLRLIGVDGETRYNLMLGTH